MRLNTNMATLPKIAIVLAIQLVIIASVVGFKQYTVWTGETVVLAVEPVDPRDPFRGDYVTFQYDISRIDPDELRGNRYAYGDVYVELRQGNDGTWDAVAIHDDREHDFDDTVLLKGEAESFGGPDNLINVEYGIEELFIPEGSGSDIPWDRDVSVEIKVDRFGNAVPRHLLVDGEKLDLERR
jgi:uncharacterized membrane-anchored protein